MLNYVKNIAKKFPIIRRLISERDTYFSKLVALKAQRAGLSESSLFVPPGHFYSPITSLEDIQKNDEKIFGNIPRTILGIDIGEKEQQNLLTNFITYYEEMPFTPLKSEKLRYYYENPAYSYSDAIMLHCMIRELCPRKIIEVGSGFSSCMILDTNDLYFEGSILTTFIEPYPELLLSLIRDEDKSKATIIPSCLQDVDLEQFEALEANDILFIDSTHVSKVNSDVNRIFFDILPRLSSGVYIHFHDIFFPFEYPKDWVYEGRSWNEAYILRAFLQFNSSFRIVLMNTFMEHFHKQFFQKNMPLCLKNLGGSIWLQKK